MEIQGQFFAEINKLRAKAAAAGRSQPLQFTLIARLILGRTEEQAWLRARRILDQVTALSGYSGRENAANRYFDGNPSIGDKQIIALAEGDARHDTALWAGISGISGRGNSAAFVCTPDVIAEALLRYTDLGVTNFILHGFDPYEDVADYGREIIPLIRQEWRHRYLRRDEAELGAAPADATRAASGIHA